jgi:hypothetical protein
MLMICALLAFVFADRLIEDPRDYLIGKIYELSRQQSELSARIAPIQVSLSHNLNSFNSAINAKNLNRMKKDEFAVVGFKDTFAGNYDYISVGALKAFGSRVQLDRIIKPAFNNNSENKYVVISVIIEELGFAENEFTDVVDDQLNKMARFFRTSYFWTFEKKR